MNEARQLDVTVVRGDTGLGIQVDENNVVAANTGSSGLQLGDRVVAVDGKVVPTGTPLGQALAPGANEYVFRVSRDAAAATASLQNLLSQLVEQHGDSEGDELEEVDGKIETVITALEEIGRAEPASKHELLGFWKLCYTNDEDFRRAGESGYGDVPFCSVVSHWQLYAEKEPAAQVVEVVANANLGEHALAAVKGEWEAESADDGLRVEDAFSRCEFGGAPQSFVPSSSEHTVTYLSSQLRVSRMASGAVRIYTATDGGAVQDEIGGLLMSPVRKASEAEELPRWEQWERDRARWDDGPQPSAVP